MENIVIPVNNILFSLIYYGKKYALVCNNEKPIEGDQAYFLEVLKEDNNMIIGKYIESDDEFQAVAREYNRLIDELGGND